MKFVDSTFLIALIREKDQWHEKAIELAYDYEYEEKVVTDLIISETVTSVGGNEDGKIGLQIFNYIQNSYYIY